MMLRNRQRQFVDKCNVPLRARKNTIGIAPTGAGKTVMLSAIVLENKPKKLPTLVLQHRDELLEQNHDTFVEYAGIRNIRRPMKINASSKAWDRAAGGWNFAMVQTLAQNLDAMPPIGTLAIDEAHHAASPSYLQIIAKAKSDNPDLLLYGTTATPNRGDRRALRTAFDNCGDQIQIGELIREGHLVRPRTFVIDIGINEALKKVKRTAIDFDMREVESIMNKKVLHDKIIEHWKQQAGHRQTIVFCSTIEHAKGVTEAFKAHGIKAEMVDGKLSTTARRDILARYDRGEIQVIVNVAVLTEGYDSQPTSCVVLLRPSSWKSTMVQMIGRGLRKVDPEYYPGIIKDDCIVLDFGTSCLTHGNLEDEPNLSGSGVKSCPDCDSTVPQNCRECPICGHAFPVEPSAPRGSGGESAVDASGILENFVMSEIDILQDSPFKYESFYHGRVMLCFGSTYWAAVVHYQDHRFYAIGAEATGDSGSSFKLRVVNSSDNYLMALQSADDYMRTKGSKTDARRVAQWLYDPPTQKQLDILMQGDTLDVVTQAAAHMGMSKYRAACGIQFKFYGKQIRIAIEGFISANEENNKKYAAA